MKSTRSTRSSALQLRAVDHTYWVGPENIIGTTEALQRIGLFDPSVYPIEARDRGDRVHRRTAAIDARARRRPAVLPDEEGYCASWSAYVALWRLEFLLVEHSLWDPDLRVAGTLDRVALVQRQGFPTHVAIIDLKTGDEEDWHRYQISIYELLVRRWIARQRRLAKLPRLLYNVYLHRDGREAKVRCVPFEPVVTNLVASAQVVRQVR